VAYRFLPSKGETDMQSYKTYASITLIANTFEILPEVGCKLSHSVIAEWMEQNDIEPEDVLYASPDIVKAKLVRLVSNNLPQIPHAT
jgi:hypothetical protein